MSETAANKLNIRVWKFESKPEDAKDGTGKPTGEIILRDYVTYGPPQAADRLQVVVRVDRLLKARKPPEGSVNIAEWQGWDLKQHIEPLYQAWKRGEELPESGMPLAACNFLRAEEIEVLKRSGIRTVQELADLIDSNMDAVRLPRMREKRAQAKTFLESQDTNKAAARIAAAEATAAETKQELDALKAQMAALMAARTAEEPEVDENGDRIPKRRGPGRPPKQAEHEAA